MTTLCKQNLQEIRALLVEMSDEHYAKPLDLFSGASIGQHVRHILEFYLCLLNGVHQKKVSYDGRERNLKLESEVAFAIYTIDKICSNLPDHLQDFGLILEGNFSTTGKTSITIQSSIYRELAYTLEHSIHHQALIKVGLRELNLPDLTTANFGVAPATIRYKDQCVQ